MTNHTICKIPVCVYPSYFLESVDKLRKPRFKRLLWSVAEHFHLPYSDGEPCRYFFDA